MLFWSSLLLAYLSLVASQRFNVGDPAFELDYVLVDEDWEYFLDVYNAGSDHTSTSRVRCSAYTKTTEGQVPMSCSFQNGRYYRQTTEVPTAVWIQQPPYTEDSSGYGRPDFRNSGVNFIFAGSG